MNETKTQFKERRIWYFTCERCGKSHRQSHKKKNAQSYICRNCRKNVVPENQQSLFSKDEEVPKCEVCGHSLVDSTVGMCDCGKYKW